MFHYRSFTDRLKGSSGASALKRRAAELGNSGHPEFEKRQKALAEKVASGDMTCADIFSVAESAPLPSTRHLIIRRAAEKEKLTTLEHVTQAVGLIQTEGEGAEAAMSAVRDAAMGLLEVTDETDADELVAIHRVAHQIRVSPELHKQITEDVARRAVAMCETADVAAALAERLYCEPARNLLLTRFACKLQAAGTLNAASALQLLRVVHGDPSKNGDVSPLRARRAILGMLALKLQELCPSPEELRELAGFVVVFEELGGEDDPDKPEDPTLAEKVIISLLVAHAGTVREALEAAFCFHTSSGFHGLLAAFVARQKSLSENEAIALALAAFKDTPGYDDFMNAMVSKVADFGPIGTLVSQLRRHAYKRRTVIVPNGCMSGKLWESLLKHMNPEP